MIETAHIILFFFMEKNRFRSNRFSAIPNNMSIKVVWLPKMRFAEDAQVNETKTDQLAYQIIIAISSEVIA